MFLIKIFFLLFFVKNNANIKQKNYVWKKTVVRYKKWINYIYFVLAVYVVQYSFFLIFYDKSFFQELSKEELKDKIKYEFEKEYKKELPDKDAESIAENVLTLPVPFRVKQVRDEDSNLLIFYEIIKNIAIYSSMLLMVYLITFDIGLIRSEYITNYFYNKKMLTKIQNTKEFVEKELSANYIVKNKAIEVIAEKIKNANEENGINSCYVFNGVTGTGKTLLAENIQTYLDHKNFNIINGTEFARYDSANTQKIHFKLMQDNTIKVILIDEFDKMAKEYQILFLELLSNKSVSITTEDKLYVKITLTKCMFIFSMNAGQNIVYDKNLSHEQKIEALQEEFDEKYGAYFTSRVNDIFIFSQIEMNEITEKELQTIFVNYISNMKFKYNIDIILDNSILEHYNKKFGIRKLITTVVDKIDGNFNRNIEKYQNKTVKVTSKNKKFNFEIIDNN